MVDSKVSKKQILDDLIKETESIKSNLYKDGDLISWSYKVRNSVKAIFDEVAYLAMNYPSFLPVD